MKKYVAKTVDDAIELALKDNELETKETLMYEVIEEKKGLFSKKAEIAVYDLADVIEYAQNYLVDVIAHFQIIATAKTTIKDDILHITLNTDHNSILIGKNGRTLQALNEVTRLAVSTHFKRRFRILLDINEYKDEKYEKIVRIARRVAREVQKTKVDATLDAMPSDERRIVHNTLSKMSHIKTESTGEGRKRQITIKYVE